MTFPGDNKQLRNQDLRWMRVWDKLEGELPPEDFVSNGCSCSPDILFGIDIRPACHVHDFHYSWQMNWPLGRNEKARYMADHWLLNNLVHCGLPKWIARIYWYRVRLFGHRSFAYDTEPKRDLRFWANLAVGRYITW